MRESHTEVSLVGLRGPPFPVLGCARLKTKRVLLREGLTMHINAWHPARCWLLLPVRVAFRFQPYSCFRTLENHLDPAGTLAL
jgi:hypothetical protein